MSFFQDPEGLRQQQAWDAAWAVDGKMSARFHMQPVLDEKETAAQGRPIYRDAVFCQIKCAGEQHNIPDREATEQDKERFAEAYRRFLAGESQVTGTPLEAVTWLTRGEVESLKAIPGAPVRTIEELAALSDIALQRMPGVRRHMERAKDFLRAAKESAPLTALRSEIEQRDTRIAELEAAREADKEAHQKQLADLAARLGALEQREPVVEEKAQRGGRR